MSQSTFINVYKNPTYAVQLRCEITTSQKFESSIGDICFVILGYDSGKKQRQSFVGANTNNDPNLVVPIGGGDGSVIFFKKVGTSAERCPGCVVQ